MVIGPSGRTAIGVSLPRRRSSIRQARRHVVDRFQVGAADVLVRIEIAVQTHPRPERDDRQQLRFPLVVQREAGRQDGVQQRAGRRRLSNSSLRKLPWSGKPSLQRDADRISPSCATICAAADIPFTAWYRFWSSG